MCHQCRDCVGVVALHRQQRVEHGQVKAHARIALGNVAFEPGNALGAGIEVACVDLHARQGNAQRYAGLNPFHR
ncbi:hypothetical protein D3C86_1690550 [compost metagenome]